VGACPPLTETATGAEQGHIAIPGADSAIAAVVHVPPMQVTVTFRRFRDRVRGRHIETLYGDLIITLYAVDPDDGSLVALPDYVSLSVSKGAKRTRCHLNRLPDQREEFRPVARHTWAVTRVVAARSLVAYATRFWPGAMMTRSRPKMRATART
jgi:hypothetical protein